MEAQRGCRSKVPCAIAFLVFLMFGMPPYCRAEYMFLDTDGDGISTRADQLNLTGPTVVDLWVSTDANRDGSPTSCSVGGSPSSQQPSVRGYGVVVMVNGGDATFGDYTSAAGAPPNTWSAQVSASEFLVGAEGGSLPPGHHKLGSFTLSVDSGNPSLHIVPGLLDGSWFTFLDTDCLNSSLRHLGPNPYAYPPEGHWRDVDGIPGPNHPPHIVAPTHVTGTGEIRVEVAVSDTDHDPILSLTADLTHLPAGHPATFSAGPDNSYGTLSWSPGESDQGTYSVTFAAQNDSTGAASTIIAVRNDTPPQILGHTFMVAQKYQESSLTFTAADPDSDSIFSIIADMTSIPGASFVVNASKTVATLRWTPGFHDVGTHSVGIRAANALPCSLSLTIVVQDHPPVIEAPATATGTVASILEIPVSSSDPDGDPRNLYADASQLPTGGTATFGPCISGHCLRWTPSVPDIGTHTVTFRVSNTMADTTQTEITVLSRPPEASLAVDRPVGSSPLQVVADASGSVDPDGVIVSYQFDFGDGDATPPQPSPTVPHVYHTGDWMLRVTVVDNNGRSSSDSVLVHVTRPGPYMFLDADGDGVNTSHDRLDLVGTTTVEVWLSTSASRTDSLPVCPSGEEPLTVFSYTLILRAVGGTVSWGTYENLAMEMTVPFETAASETDLHTGFGGTTILPPGRYKIGRLQVAALSGSPRIEISQFTTLGYWLVTSFGSSCPGIDYDHTLELGVDWHDVDGLGAPQPNSSPSVVAPPDTVMHEGDTLELAAHATDSDAWGDLVLSATGVPGHFTVTGGTGPSPTTVVVSGSLQSGDVGTIEIIWTARDADGGVCADTTTVTVLGANQPPVAEAGGPYAGARNAPILFDGSGSTDPDGQPLAFAWDFGDGIAGVGQQAAHTFSAVGNYTARLVVSDGSLASADSALAVVEAMLAARVVVPDGGLRLNLGSGRLSWCLQLEPLAGAFRAEAINLSSVRLSADSIASSTEIRLSRDAAIVGADTDGNGTPEISLCFRLEDLQQLFGEISGITEVAVLLGARLTDETPIRASAAVQVEGMNGPLAVGSFPNPMRGMGHISVRTATPGSLRLRLFDSTGRMVRQLLDTASQPGGYLPVRFDGRDAAGRELPSGVYFYRVESSTHAVNGRLLLLR